MCVPRERVREVTAVILWTVRPRATDRLGAISTQYKYEVQVHSTINAHMYISTCTSYLYEVHRYIVQITRKCA